jgi:hypothetical protein
MKKRCTAFALPDADVIFFTDLQMLYDTIVHFNLGFLVTIHVTSF